MNEAFEKILEKLDELIEKSYSSKTEGNRNAGIKNRAYHKVKKIVQEVEEEYNSSWIPCSERLPKKEKKTYWVCTDTEYQCECRWTNNRFGFGEGEWGWSIFDTPQYSKPIAWMPLPEPYKTESEVEKNDREIFV